METITILAIEEDGHIRPERELTDLEKSRVNEMHSNGNEYVYYLNPVEENQIEQ
jgi:hypothetical protein